MKKVLKISFMFIFLAVSLDLFACDKGVKSFRKVLNAEMEHSQAQVQVEARATSATLMHESKAAKEVGGDGLTLTSRESKSTDILDQQVAQQAERENASLLRNDFIPDDISETEKASRLIMESPNARAKVRAQPSVDVFKKTYAKSTLNFDNRHFISSVKEVPDGKKAIYFDVENSVLKQLNDEIFETKDLGDAAGNLYNKILYDKIRNTPELASKLNGKYRDFKSLRFQFLIDEGEDSKKVLDLLKKIYGESASEFEKQLKATGLGPLWNARSGQTGNPEKWFLAGAGDSPLEANMAARQARGMLSETGSSNRMILYSDRVDALATDIKRIEKIRTALGEIPELQKAKIIVDAGGGNLVLSKDAIGVLRKTKRADFKDLDKYREAVNKQFKQVFGTKVDDVSIDGMTKYFEGVDSLSPPLFVRSRAGIDLSQANHGLVSVDFTGVGVDNAYEAMKGLAKNSSVSGTNSAYVDKALRAVDGHVDTVTDTMNTSKRVFNDSTQKVTGTEKSATFSGDDGMYFPDAEWTKARKQKLVDELSTRGNSSNQLKPDPSKYRVTFVDTKYKEGSSIPSALRSEYIVKAEKVEKDIRKTVVGLGAGQISPERAKDMLIAIEYRPGLKSRGDWDIVFGGQINHTEQTVIRRALETIIEKNKH